MEYEKKFQINKKLSAVLVFSLLISPLLPFSNDLKINFASAASTLPPYSSILDSSLKNADESGEESSVPQMTDFAKYGTKVLGCNNSAGLFRKALSDLNAENADITSSGTSAVTGSSDESALKDMLSSGVGDNAGNGSSDGTIDFELNKYGNVDAEINSASDIGAIALTTGSQPVADAGVLKSLKKLNDNQKKIMEDSANKKVWEQCLNGIAVKISQKQIASMSQGILNWVNTGFNGDPLFVRDQESFFKKIQNDSLQSFIAPFTDPTNASLYPYGKSTAQMLVNNSKITFSDVAKSTLQDSLPEGVTTEDFSKDFSKGGWTGWLSLTQNPANNPLGFTLMASEEALKQESEKVQIKKDELLQGKGFLSATKCIEQSSPDGTVGQESTYRETGNSLNSGDPTCIRTEVVTPGSIIADQASAVLTSPIRQLELAKTVNDSLDQVFNSLVNQLTTKGLSSLDSYARGSVTMGDVPALNMLEKPFYDTYSNLIKVNQGYGGWYRSGDDFDITRDLGDIYTPAFEYREIIDPVSVIAGGTKTVKIPILDAKGKQKKIVAKKGIISIQEDYIIAATESLKALDPILPAIGELDYCIPGPNPSWETRTKNRIYDLQNYLSNMSYNGKERISEPKWLKTDANLSTAQGIVSGLGVALSGPTGGISLAVAGIFAGVVALIHSSHANKNAANAAEIERQNLKSEFYFNSNQSGLVNSLTTRFGLYQTYIKQRYTKIFGGYDITGGTEPQCNDGIDNDNNGLKDSADPGCHSDLHPNNASSWDKERGEDKPQMKCNDNRSESSQGQNTTNGGLNSLTVTDNMNPDCYPTLSPRPKIELNRQKFVVPNGTNGLTVTTIDPRYVLAQYMGPARTLDPIADGYDKYFDGYKAGVARECSDGIENDTDGVSGAPDGYTDALDPGCHTDGNRNNPTTYNRYGNSESNSTVCRNNTDDDGDGTKDMGDTGCHSDLDASNIATYLPYRTSEIHLDATVQAQLPMAAAGLNITKDIENYDANIAQAKKDYKTEVTEVKNNIVKLKSIKTEVDKIMKDAQDRRNAKIFSMKKAALPNEVNFCPGVDPDPTLTAQVDPNGSTGGSVQ